MKKLTSRKFLACVVGIISGLALCFGADANIVTEIGGITATVFSIVSYIIVEGNIDAAALEQMETLIEEIKKLEEE